jgi:hypothetical protein
MIRSHYDRREFGFLIRHGMKEDTSLPTSRQSPLLEYTSTTTPTTTTFSRKHINIKVESSTTYIPGGYTYEQLDHQPPADWRQHDYYTGKGRIRQGNYYKELTRKDWKEGVARQGLIAKRVYPIFYFCSLVL